MKKPTIKIRKLKRVLENDTELWLFLKHEKPYSNFDLRWAIGYRKRDKWWGVIAMFPATNEKAINMIAHEMELAKEAIGILKGKLLKV